MLVIDPKTRPNVAPEVKHTIASKLRMIKANPLLEARGLVARPSKNKVAENKASNLLAGRNPGQLNAFPSTSVLKSSQQHTAPFKSSFSFKSTVKSIDSIANDKSSSGVYSASIKRCISARRSLSADPPLNNSVFNEVDDAKNIRRIRSVANIPGKVFSFTMNLFCLGMREINQNYIHKRIKSRLSSGNTCYHSFHSLLSSCSLSKNVKIKLTLILSLLLCECDTWSVTLKK